MRASLQVNAIVSGGGYGFGSDQPAAGTVAAHVPPLNPGRGAMSVTATEPPAFAEPAALTWRGGFGRPRSP
ncbi:hypothetical protein [Streptomyces sp. NPDC008139]|uniref:hypothetical protein n=1 Tax=Streptomyces sp. NPDC008139 TaxID=3364814 RepID=UPI0036E34B19